MLDKEYKYYLENKKQLLKQYKGKFIVIKNNKVIGAFSSKEQAYDNTIKKNKLGTFLIQYCLPENQKVTQSFHSRVIF